VTISSKVVLVQQWRLTED